MHQLVDFTFVLIYVEMGYEQAAWVEQRAIFKAITYLVVSSAGNNPCTLFEFPVDKHGQHARGTRDNKREDAGL